MTTINQLIRKPRRPKIKKDATPALCGQPQRKGTCIKVTTVKPKKPNSALRKIAIVRLQGPAKGAPNFNKSKLQTMTVSVSIKGERAKNNLKEHDVITIQGGGAKDLPGCNFKTVPGRLSDLGVVDRKKSRSRYGTKRPKPGTAKVIAKKK
ncbi:MAG: 30S ribosomal protein S12 [Rickettsiales bacterium]